MMSRKLVIAAVGAVAACTGMTFGENKPGADTYMEAEVPDVRQGEVGYSTGAIAVDDRDETAFVLQVSADRRNTEEAILGKDLYAVSPDEAPVRKVASFDGSDDLRVLFPRSGVLVMHEEQGLDTLSLFARGSLEPLATEPRAVRYHGTRMAPSRRWVAVADNTSDHAPIHVIDGDTLETHVIPHDGDWLESMWMNRRDELLAIVFYDSDVSGPSARILSWSMDDVAQGGFGEEHGLWARPRLNVEVAGAEPDLFFSYTWVAVSPDDSRAVFPVVTRLGDDRRRHDLLVLATATGQVRRVEDASGPVGFTPDGRTIVSYADAEDGNQDLLLIDGETLGKKAETVPVTGGLSYFVSHEGNFVVVASSYGDQRLVLYDIDNERQTKMDGPALGLYEFVSRLGHGELWLVDDEGLFRLDLFKGVVESVPNAFSPHHVNILPGRDLLVLDDSDGNSLWYFDPEGRTTKRVVSLPED